jgi:hypothetical protein
MTERLQDDAFASLETMREWVAGRRGHPPPGTALQYVETQWSYRRPVAYAVLDQGEGMVAEVVPPADGRRQALVVRDGAVLLRTDISRRGDTLVTGAAGTPLGLHRRRGGFLKVRLQVEYAGAVLGTVEPVPGGGTSLRFALETADGRHLLGLRREGRVRFAGADRTWLEILPGAEAVPAPLLLTLVPALDAMLKQFRAGRRA